MWHLRGARALPPPTRPPAQRCGRSRSRAGGTPPIPAKASVFTERNFKSISTRFRFEAGRCVSAGCGPDPVSFGDEDPVLPMFHRVLSQVSLFLNPTPVCASRKYFRDASGADPAEPGTRNGNRDFPPPNTHTPRRPDHPQGRRGSASVGSALDSSFRGGKDWVPRDRAGRRAKLAPSRRRTAGPAGRAKKKKNTENAKRRRNNWRRNPIRGMRRSARAVPVDRFDAI